MSFPAGKVFSKFIPAKLGAMLAKNVFSVKIWTFFVIFKKKISLNQASPYPRKGFPNNI